MKRLLVVFAMVAAILVSCSEKCPLEPHREACEDLYGALYPPEGADIPLRDLRVRTLSGSCCLNRDLSFCLPGLPGTGAGVIVATVSDTVPIMLGYVFPQKTKAGTGDYVPVILGEELRRIVRDASGAVRISAASTALGLVMLSPFLGGATVQERAHFASLAARHAGFGELTADVCAAMVSSPKDIFDQETNPGIYEQAALIVSNLIDLEKRGVTYQSVRAPYVLDGAGDFVDLVNPTFVHYGVRVAAEGVVEPDTVLLVSGRDIEAIVRPGPVSVCEYLLGSGRFDIEFYKGFAGFDATRRLDPTHAGGLATLANAEQVIWSALTIPVGCPALEDPGSMDIEDAGWVESLAEAIEAEDPGKVLDLAVAYLCENPADFRHMLCLGELEPIEVRSYLAGIRGILIANTAYLENADLTARLPFHSDLFATADHESLLVCQRDGAIVPCENAPLLTQGRVSPLVGYTDTVFTYAVHYYDHEGQAPSDKRVVIDGRSFVMELADGVPADGTYRYRTTLEAGLHSYYFECTDTHGDTGRLPASGVFEGPTVSYAPELSDGKVLPAVGSVLTGFRFEVDYYDGDGDAPAYVYVYVDDDPGEQMILETGTSSEGTYCYETQLPLGAHEHYFGCADVGGAVTRLPDSGTFTGPLVYAPEGRNPDTKIAVHVRAHDAKAGCDYGAILHCWDIVTTAPDVGVDAFPVFFDLVEYQAVEYGLTWPAWFYSAAWYSCCDLAAGEIRRPGDGVTQMWNECRSEWAAVPGYVWLYADGPGYVCVCPHPTSGGIHVYDCSGGMDGPMVWICAGVYGYVGDDPCPPIAHQPALGATLDRFRESSR